MEKVEEIYAFLEKNREYNFELIKKIKAKFDEALGTGNYSRVCEIPDLYDRDRLVMTGELAKINNLLTIYANETTEGHQCSFFDGVSDYSKLHEKYLKTILMIRRLEQFDEDELLMEACEYLSNIDISPEAFFAILGQEYFEQKKRISFKIYSLLKNGMSAETEKRWIMRFVKAGYLNEQ